jgi:hypothetical protein
MYDGNAKASMRLQQHQNHGGDGGGKWCGSVTFNVRGVVERMACVAHGWDRVKDGNEGDLGLTGDKTGVGQVIVMKIMDICDMGRRPCY